MKASNIADDDDFYDQYDFVNIAHYEHILYEPRPFKVYYGGRASRKSTLFAKALLRISFSKKCFVVCIRKTLKSLDDSSLRLLSEIIDANSVYKKCFRVLTNRIINIANGGEFIFRGLSTATAGSIRSLHGVTHVWVEEGQYIQALPWHELSPTIRKSGSEVWVTMNPIHDTDVLYDQFIVGQQYYKNDLLLKKLSWRDNPYLSKRTYREMIRDKNRDYDLYLHKWEGECLKNSEAQVFKYGTHWIIDKFDDDPKAFKYQGMDFGYSGSPTFVLQMFIKDRKLFITYEAVKLGLDIDDTGAYCESQIPNFKKWAIYADSAIPALISFLKRQGYKVEPVKKGAGSIEDGVGFMKSFEMIIVHERCVNMIQNMNKYSFVVDDRSGIISNTFEDANNDGIDAARYGLESLARSSRADYSKIKVPEWMR